MRIVDYERGMDLSDVGVILTMEEAQDLCAYLERLQTTPMLHKVHLSEFAGVLLRKELTVALNSVEPVSA